MDISYITRKFPHYQSREALQAEHRRTQPFMEQFLAAMYSDIAMVQAAGWNFAVFWIKDLERTLHCGLYHCCKETVGTPEMREDLAIKIYKRLPYDKIVWEI